MPDYDVYVPFAGQIKVRVEGAENEDDAIELGKTEANKGLVIGKAPGSTISIEDWELHDHLEDVSSTESEAFAELVEDVEEEDDDSDEEEESEDLVEETEAVEAGHTVTESDEDKP